MSAAAEPRSLQPMSTIVIPMIAFGLAAVGLATLVERRASPQTLPARSALIAADTFDRNGLDGQDGLAGLPGDREWNERSGSWAISLGRAYVDAGPGAAVALIDGPPGGEAIAIKAVIGGTSSCGIVGRYVDEANFVSLTRIPGSGAWALAIVSEGEARVVQRLEAQEDANATVQLTLRPGGITAIVGAQRATAAEPSPAEPSPVDAPSGGFGMFAAEFSSSCTWDNVIIAVAR